MRKDSVTASYCLYAFGQHNAIGYSPFGIEDLALDPGEMDIPPMEVMMALNIDPSAFDIAGSREYLSRVYELMEQMKPLYLKYRGTEHLRSYVKSRTLISARFYDLKTMTFRLHTRLKCSHSQLRRVWSMNWNRTGF